MFIEGMCAWSTAREHRCHAHLCSARKRPSLPSSLRDSHCPCSASSPGPAARQRTRGCEHVLPWLVLSKAAAPCCPCRMHVLPFRPAVP